MNLPPALAPWAPFLTDFPLELGAALGAMSQRVAALLGPSGEDFDQPEGEVDGYDGLSRRGLPERMLLSDWLLAGEVPDEWMRRAAEGELNYLQLARRAPRQSQVVAALFDAGPDLLGAPRLGQLAALLVLARRAREKGAELRWGIAQKPTSQLWRDVSPSGAMALLEARGSLPATQNDLEMWRQALGARDELWLIGGPEFVEFALAGESKLGFEDPFEVGCEVGIEAKGGLDVAAHPRGREVRRARLELPPDAISTRLLRDPFGAKVEAGASVRRIKTSLAPASNPIWINGNTLAARTNGGGIAVFRVPSSPRGGVAKPKHYQAQNAKFDYVGEYNGSILGAQLYGGGVNLANIGGRAQTIATGFYKGRDTPWSFEEMDSSVLQPLWNLGIGKHQPVLLLPGGELTQLVPLGNEPVGARGNLETIERPICAAQSFENGLIAASNSDPSRIVRFQADARAPKGFSWNVSTSQGHVRQAFWNCSSFVQGGRFCWNAAAYYRGPDRWFMQWTEAEKERREPIEVARGETVFGVVGWNSKPSPALLVRGENERGLSLRGVGWNQVLSSEAIESAVVSPLMPYLAWLSGGELTTYSLLIDAVLARWQWGDE